MPVSCVANWLQVGSSGASHFFAVCDLLSANHNYSLYIPGSPIFIYLSCFGKSRSGFLFSMIWNMAREIRQKLIKHHQDIYLMVWQVAGIAISSINFDVLQLSLSKVGAKFSWPTEHSSISSWIQWLSRHQIWCFLTWILQPREEATNDSPKRLLTVEHNYLGLWSQGVYWPSPIHPIEDSHQVLETYQHVFADHTVCGAVSRAVSPLNIRITRSVDLLSSFSRFFIMPVGSLSLTSMMKWRTHTISYDS